MHEATRVSVRLGREDEGIRKQNALRRLQSVRDHVVHRPSDHVSRVHGSGRRDDAVDHIGPGLLERHLGQGDQHLAHLQGELRADGDSGVAVRHGARAVWELHRGREGRSERLGHDRGGVF